jgi:hypothetical protein
MTAAMYWYDHSWKLINTGGLDLDTSELRIRLVTSSYTFNSAHTQWDNGANDSTDPSYNELTTTGGYTVGGKQLTTPVVTNSNIDYDDLTWTSLTATFRQVICVAVGTFGGVTNPVVWRMLPNSDDTDVISVSTDWSINWNATNKLFYKP